MTVITDAPEYAATLLGSTEDRSRHLVDVGIVDSVDEWRVLANAFFEGRPAVLTTGMAAPRWRHLVVSGFAMGSQYDRLIGLARQKTPLPDGIACVARTGVGFQGFHGRSWIASPGNVHLSVHLAPERRIERFETVFMALAAVSVIEAIDLTADLHGRAGIKWVNDIVIEGAKVAGVLAYSQTRGDHVTSVVLGIGLNVECPPVVRPTPFVPQAACLRDFSTMPMAIRVGDVLHRLLAALGRNYELLLRGGFRPIMDRYRARSVVLGRDVAISSDDSDEIPRVFATGRVDSISDGMELYLAGGERPITRGRLILPTENAVMANEHHPFNVQLGVAS